MERKSYVKKAVFMLILVGIFLPASGGIGASTIEEIRSSLDRLILELERLRAEFATEKTSVFFTKPLWVGTKGPEVTLLQQVLKEQPGIYPEGNVTGNYDAATEQAVRRFQTANNIEAVGFVGPKTRTILNEVQTKRVLASNLLGSVATTSPVLTREILEEDRTRATYALDPRPAYDERSLEFAIHNLINQSRAQNGISPIFWNDDLATIARRHSDDQSADNIETTRSEIPCAYPILRHSGFNFGFTVGERLQTSGVPFRSAGENLVTFPVSKKLVYRYAVGDGPVQCPEVSSVDPEVPTERALEREVEERQDALEDIPGVNWVNREWLTEQEIAEKAARLWLESPGHRENILSPEYSEGGIGVSFINDYIIITQVFRES